MCNEIFAICKDVFSEISNADKKFDDNTFETGCNEFNKTIGSSTKGFDTIFAKGLDTFFLKNSCSSLCSSLRRDGSAEEGRYNKASVGEPCFFPSESFIYYMIVTFLKLSDGLKVNTQTNMVEK
jgi:hypothetical protein